MAQRGIFTPANSVVGADKTELNNSLAVGVAESFSTALAESQLLLSKAINSNGIVSAIVECCKKLFSSPNYIGVYLKRTKFFENRLPHERKTSRLPFGQGILGNVIAKTTEPMAFSSAEAQDSPYYSRAIDTFRNEACHLLYIPVAIKNAGLHSVIKICRECSPVQSAPPFSEAEVMLAKFVGRQVAVSFENAKIAMGSFALSNIAEELEGSIHVKKAIAQLEKAAKSNLGCRSAMIFLEDYETLRDDGVPLLHYTYNEQNNLSLKVPKDRASYVGQCALENNVILVDIQREKKPKLNKRVESTQGFASRSVMCIPIIGTSRTSIGVLRVANKQNFGQFTRKDRVLLQGLAATANVVIRNAQINEAALKAQSKTASLLHIAKVLNGKNDLLGIVQTIQYEARKLIECDKCSVFLHDGVTDELFTVALGPDGNPFEIRFASSLGLAGYSYTNEKMLNIPDAWEDDRFNSSFDKINNYRTKSVLVVNIKNQEGKNIGVLQCINKMNQDAFTEMDENLVDSFACQCAIAIENLRNAERLADLKRYFAMHEASAYDIFFELDANKTIIDISRDEQSVELFPIAVDKIIGKNWAEYVGETNDVLIKVIDRMDKYPHGMMLKEVHFAVPGGQTLTLDCNIVPYIYTSEKGHTARNSIEDHFDHFKPRSYEHFHENQSFCSHIIYCSNMKVKTSASVLVEASPIHKMLLDECETDSTPMIVVSFDVPKYLRQKILVGIMNEIHVSKGVLHSIENNTIYALFGTPHSSANDISQVCSASQKILDFLEMAMETFSLERGGSFTENFLFEAGIISAKTRLWNRWTNRCTYQIYPESLEKARWITEQANLYGTHILVDEDIAMHLPNRIMTRQVGVAVWAGGCVDITRFKHLSPFEQQRAILKHLEETTEISVSKISLGIYEIIPDSVFDKHEGWLRKFNKALHLFNYQEWGRAVKIFNEILHDHSDVCTRVYKNLCTDFINSNVRFNSSWKGLWQPGCERFLLNLFDSNIDLSVWNTEHIADEEILPSKGKTNLAVLSQSHAGVAAGDSAAGLQAPGDDALFHHPVLDLERAFSSPKKKRMKSIVLGNNYFSPEKESKNEMLQIQEDDAAEAKVASDTKEVEEAKDPEGPEENVVKPLPLLMHLLVPDAKRADVERYITDNWGRYDIDRDNVLNASELIVFIEHHTGTSLAIDDMVDVAVGREPVTAAFLSTLFSSVLQLSDDERGQYAGLSELHKAMDVAAHRVDHTMKHRKDPLVYFFRQMWPKFDVESDGTLNEVGAEKMIQYFTEKIPERVAVTSFLTALNGGDNPSIKKEDLVQLVQDAASMSRAERQQFSEEKEENKFLLELLDGVRRTYEITIEGYVASLFFIFDLDRDHGLNVLEATVLFQTYGDQDISKPKLEKFLEQIDMDGDNVVQLEELVRFIKDGTAMTPLQRNQYASRGKFHGVLLKFLDGIKADREMRLPLLMHLLVPDAKRADVERYITDNWGRYDIDRDNVLNASELIVFIEHHTGTSLAIDDMVDVAVGREPVTAAFLSTLFSSVLQLSDDERGQYAGLSELHKAMDVAAHRVDHTMKHRKDPLVYFFRQMWPKFDVESDGTLNEVGAEKMIQYFTEKIPERVAVTSFLTALNGGDNPSIKKEDLVQLVQDAASMSRAERQQFSEEKEENKFLLELLDGVVEKYESTLEGYIASIYPYFDLDNDDGLNVIEARVLFQSFSNQTVSREQVSQFLSKIDSDGDNAIQLDELAFFVGSGISLTPSQKQDYGARGAFHAILLKFFDGIKADREKAVANVAFEQFFCKIDTDSSGTITKKELLKSLRKTNVFNSIAQKYDVLKPLMNTKTFLTTFEKINSSNSGEVTMEEFKAFVSTKLQTSERDIALEKFFKDVDTDNSGTITKKELLKAMSKPKVFEAVALKHESLRPLLNGKTYLQTFRLIAKKREGVTFDRLQEFVNKL
mgnify:CR=1 FL=1